MQNLSVVTALGACKLIAEGTGSVDFSTFGLNNDDRKILTGSRLWLAADRPIIDRLINTLIYGVMDVVGVAIFPVSAEYMAAVVAMFVHPTNLMVACQWMDRAQSNADLADGVAVKGAQLALPGQLFALVTLLYSSDISAFRDQFNKRVGFKDGVSDKK